MTGIEPVSCDIWSARSANYATTTLNFLYKIVSTKIEDLIKLRLDWMDGSGIVGQFGDIFGDSRKLGRVIK